MCTYRKLCLYYQHSDDKQNHRDKERHRLDFASSFYFSTSFPLTTAWDFLFYSQNNYTWTCTMCHYSWKSHFNFQIVSFFFCTIITVRQLIYCNPWRCAIIAKDLYSCQMRSSRQYDPHLWQSQIASVRILTVWHLYNTLTILIIMLLLPVHVLRAQCTVVTLRMVPRSSWSIF